MGLRAGSEFVAAIILGGAIGWGLDWVLHSKPAFTIVFFLLGAAAGVWSVMRATSPKRGA
jgi:ATP synthase protein I